MAPHDPSPTAATVAVVTVSFDSMAVLPAFLESLGDATERVFKVVVADNRPRESAGVDTIARDAGADYLPLATNVGYGGAVNAAVRTVPSSVPWILISNPDVVLAPNSIDALIEVARSDQRIAAVGPAIRTEAGELYPSARSVPSLRNGIGHALFANLWVTNPWTRAYRNDREGQGVRRDSGWLSGACMLVRHSAFADVGGFDPGYFMYFEDVDLGYRFGRAGFRNVYEPAASVTHAGAHSTNAESIAMVRAHHLSARRFLSKRYSGAALWPIRAALGASLAVRSSFARRGLPR